MVTQWFFMQKCKTTLFSITALPSQTRKSPSVEDEPKIADVLTSLKNEAPCLVKNM